MKTSFEYYDKRVVSTFGGQELRIRYTLTHWENHIKNEYLVTCKMGGIENAQPVLHFMSSECINPTNEETLTEDGVANLWDDLTC